MDKTYTQWFVFLDRGQTSKDQLEYLNQEKSMFAGLRGIDCSADENKDLKACEDIPAFPAWCSEEHGKCAIGLRDSEALVTIHALTTSLI